MKKGITCKELEARTRDMEPETALQFLLDMKAREGASVDRLLEKVTKRCEARQKELDRLKKMCLFEQEAFDQGICRVAGVDEAGRGPLAGPVVAAAVILPQGMLIEGLNDSKQLTPRQRDVLFEQIREKALAYGIGCVHEQDIDEINILNATRCAMKDAVQQLIPQPELVLTDAVDLPELPLPQKHIIKGDCLSISIAAASILAKVTRDRYIDEMDVVYPQYGFAKHKGYGTREHIEAIKKFGLCPIHRVSFTKHFV